MNGNRQWVLQNRPGAQIAEDTFRLQTVPMPQAGPGELLVRNVYIPVDPGMRAALLDAQVGVDEFAPFPIGGVVGYVSVGQVVESRDARFVPGDWVTDILLWQEYAIASAATARKLDCSRFSPADWLGILGIPGLSAWSGLVCLGQPRGGETVVVTSAAGTVGSIVGQIARNLGCRVVGVAGGAEKCSRLVEDLGFDAAVDYRAETDLTAAIRRASPDGVDVLFDNVGSAMIDAVIPAMRVGGRIVVCGQVAEYHLPAAQRPGLRQLGRFVSHRLSMRGLFVYDHAERWDEAIAQMAEWMEQGRLTLEQTTIDGFENLPDAFARLFDGRASGRIAVHLGQP